jgi:exodeoxyribonuclease VII large subunit
VIQDIRNILKRRAPQIEILVVPALMQGADTAAQVIRGIELSNRFALGEVIVLARGGGSIEDLWGFNHENLARAIDQSGIPIISAIGHETDFTISDFVADLRAPTPSAAAEILSSHWVESQARFLDSSVRLKEVIVRDLRGRTTLLSHIAARLINPKDRLREQAQRVDELVLRLERTSQIVLNNKQNNLNQLAGKLDALSPLRVLKRGYTLVRDPAQGNLVVGSSKKIRSGQELEITFYDGQRSVRAL